MRAIDVDAFKANYRMADDCEYCKTCFCDCEYDRVYTKMDFCSCLDDAPTIEPEQRWIPCVDGNEPKANADCWISTNAKYVRRASYAPKANNQPNGFIVTEGGFGFYEYGKSAKAWMPYEEPEPFREEGGE